MARYVDRSNQDIIGSFQSIFGSLVDYQRLKAERKHYDLMDRLSLQEERRKAEGWERQKKEEDIFLPIRKEAAEFESEMMRDRYNRAKRVQDAQIVSDNALAGLYTTQTDMYKAIVQEKNIANVSSFVGLLKGTVDRETAVDVDRMNQLNAMSSFETSQELEAHPESINAFFTSESQPFSQVTMPGENMPSWRRTTEIDGKKKSQDWNKRFQNVGKIIDQGLGQGVQVGGRAGGVELLMSMYQQELNKEPSLEDVKNDEAKREKIFARVVQQWQDKVHEINPKVKFGDLSSFEMRDAAGVLFAPAYHRIMTDSYLSEQNGVRKKILEIEKLYAGGASVMNKGLAKGEPFEQVTKDFFQYLDDVSSKSPLLSSLQEGVKGAKVANEAMNVTSKLSKSQAFSESMKQLAIMPGTSAAILEAGGSLFPQAPAIGPVRAGAPERRMESAVEPRQSAIFGTLPGGKSVAEEDLSNLLNSVWGLLSEKYDIGRRGAV